MTLGGYMGKWIFVDLATGTIEEECFSDEILKQYVGGYGLGAHVLYTRQKPSVDPLGSEAILGILTGPLTGTAAITGNRFVVVGKSPKTRTWGDANCGGNLGPMMKQAGFDGVFFTGISERPVYLLLEEGKAELLSAEAYWGKSMPTSELESQLKEKHGNDAAIASIGPAGEMQSMLACVMNDEGRAAGRSGLGAVMGAKRLKALLCRGTREVPVTDKETLRAIRQENIKYMRENSALFDVLNAHGTAGITSAAISLGDSPVKNWCGNVEDFANPDKISDDNVIGYQDKKYGCWHCPIGCGGHVRVKEGVYATEGHKPEYETLAAFGSMCGNDNVESIIKLNKICNEAGMDTISTGATVAFAIECYERGIITQEQTGGLELKWGNHEAIVAVTDSIAKAEGIGKVLAKGAAMAAEDIGKGAEALAIHIAGEEIAMHDPRCYPGLSTSLRMDASPGRHTQGGAWFKEASYLPQGLPFDDYEDKYTYAGKASAQRVLSSLNHVVNAAGQCQFGWVCSKGEQLPDALSAVMGIPLTNKDLIRIGDRIGALRIAFNIREGIRNIDLKLPERIVGVPPQPAGPTKGITVDQETQITEYLELAGYAADGVPSKELLTSLDLQFVIPDIYDRS